MSRAVFELKPSALEQINLEFNATSTRHDGMNRC
jgi:hypothetical protein